MFGYIYKTTDLLTNKIYVGKKHSTIFLGNKYVGSGIIINNIKEKCKQNNIPIEARLYVEMIDQADSLDELNKKEIFWIEHLNARDPTVGYNIRKGGDCGPGGPMFAGHSHSEITKHNMSINRRGQKNANYGNRWKHTPDMHYHDLKGKNNPMYNKKHSEASKKLNAEKQTGVIFYSNKEKDIVLRFTKNDLINEDELLSNGFYKGNWHCTKEYRNRERATTIESIN